MKISYLVGGVSLLILVAYVSRMFGAINFSSPLIILPIIGFCLGIGHILMSINLLKTNNWTLASLVLIFLAIIILVIGLIIGGLIGILLIQFAPLVCIGLACLLFLIGLVSSLKNQ